MNNDIQRDEIRNEAESNLLESFEFDVSEVGLARVDAVRPEVFVAKFGSFRRAGVGRPPGLERRRAGRTVRLGTLRHFRLVNLNTRERQGAWPEIVLCVVCSKMFYSYL